MKADALEMLSAIPFLLSGRKTLTPKEWCFILSFDWGLPYGLTPTLALKILRLALEEGVLEEQDGQLKAGRELPVHPLFFHGKKIDFSGLKEVEPYPLRFKVEVDREEAKAPPRESLHKAGTPQKAAESTRETATKTEKARKAMEEKEREKKEEKKFKQATLF